MAAFYVCRQVVGSVAVSISSILWGCSIAWPAVALPQLRQLDNSTVWLEVDDTTASWIGSSMPIGGAIGALLTGLGIDWLGRKRFMLVLYFTSAFGWVLIYWAQSVPLLCVGRALTGACSAGSSGGPAYIAEISSKNIRGALGSMIRYLVLV